MIAGDLGRDDLSAGSDDDRIGFECLDLRNAQAPTQLYLDRQALDLPQQIIQKRLVLRVHRRGHHQGTTEVSVALIERNPVAPFGCDPRGFESPGPRADHHFCAL